MASVKPPVSLFSQSALAHNERALDAFRSASAALAGVTAGICGLSGIWGFAFFAGSSLLMSALVYSLRVRPMQPEPVLPSTRALFTDGLTSGVLTFVLFWTLAYAVIWIYG